MPVTDKGAPVAGRRKDILDAALACFMDKGVLATTIEDIRLASGASIGSLYHHFGSKEELAATLYLEGMRDYQDGAVAALRRHPGAEAGVKAAVVHHLRWVMGHRDLARFIFAMGDVHALGPRSDELREMNRRFFGECSRWLSEQVQAGQIRKVPSDLYYALWIGPAHELARHLLSGRVRTRWQTAADLLAEAAWQALREPRSS
jgi:AcrR family transcriptional regulator